LNTVSRTKIEFDPLLGEALQTPVQPLDPSSPLSGQHVPQRLRSIVLLGGSVGRSGLTAAIGRSLLDLPLSSSQRVMDHWLRQIRDFNQTVGPTHTRLLIDVQSPLPTLHDDQTLIVPERDPRPYRGTGGLLRDLAEGYGFDGWMLVVNSAQFLLAPLAHLYARLHLGRGDIRLMTEENGHVSGVMLINCQALRSVPEVGYFDLKEQLLSKARNQGSGVGVVRQKPQIGISVRERSRYLQAVAHQHADVTALNDFDDDAWATRFAVVEPGAFVHPSAVIHDSVVLAGARVAAGAAVIHSVLCSSANVATGQVVRNSVIA
jgi:hypothetical protein